MIEYLNIDLFKCPANIIIHSCNCFNTFGAGIARDIRLKYPRAYSADCMTKRGDKSKLGQFSVALSNDDQPFHILNCYTQYFYGRNKRQVDYDKFYEAIKNAHDWSIKMEKYPVIGCPYKISCNNAGGDWDGKILPALKLIFDKDGETKLIICQKE